MADKSTHKIILARINWDNNGSWWLEIDRELQSMQAISSNIDTTDMKHSIHIVRERLLIANQVKGKLSFPSQEMRELFEAFKKALKGRLG